MPAGKSDQRHGNRKSSADERTDVGHKTQEGRANSPQQRVRHTNKIKRDSKQEAVTGVHQELKQEIAAQAAAGVVERLSHEVELTAARQPDRAIAQVFPPEEHKQGENDYDSRGFNRAGKRPQQSAQVLHQIRRGSRDLNWDWAGRLSFVLQVILAGSR